jgi:hypothetical protein
MADCFRYLCRAVGNEPSGHHRTALRRPLDFFPIPVAIGVGGCLRSNKFILALCTAARGDHFGRKDAPAIALRDLLGDHSPPQTVAMARRRSRHSRSRRRSHRHRRAARDRGRDDLSAASRDSVDVEPQRALLPVLDYWNAPRFRKTRIAAQCVRASLAMNWMAVRNR